MPIPNKQKYKKLVFDYATDVCQHTSAVQIQVHKTILARVNKLLELISKRVVQYRYSIRIDISRFELEITTPIAIKLVWALHSGGDFVLLISVRDSILDNIRVQSLHDDVIYVDSKVVRGSDRYQATAFAKALNSMLSDIASLEREHITRVRAVTGRLTNGNPARVHAIYN